MFSHMMLGADDVEASRKFYDAILGVLGYGPGIADPKGRYVYPSKKGSFLIGQPIDGEPTSHGNGSTLGFSVKTPEEVDQWHEAGLAAGGTTCEEPPGLREGGGMKLYLAYLRDPSGNKVCALHRVK